LLALARVSRVRSLICALIVIAGASLQTPARAQASASDGPEVKEARQHFEAGRALYELGNYDDAIHEFLIGYDLSHKPLFLFILGQCYRKLGRLTDARAAYQKFLAEAPAESERRAEAARLLTEIDQQLAARVRPRAAEVPSAAPPSAAGAPGITAATPTSEPTARPASPLAPAAPTRETRSPPVYKRWWLWTTIGLVTVAGVSVGLGLGLGLHGFEPTLPTVTGGTASPSSMALPLGRGPF
jgi:hypothetical protein